MERQHKRALPKELSAQKQLWFHWLRSADRLKALMSRSDEGPPLNGQTEFSREGMRQVSARLEGYELLTARILRIEAYLGYKRMRSIPDSPSWVDIASAVRKRIEKGDSDAAIALLLERLCKPQKKTGRPSGSGDPEKKALLALELRESDRKYWSWAKIADQVCKQHKSHRFDDDCVDRLKHSVGSLRNFLAELRAD